MSSHMSFEDNINDDVLESDSDDDYTENEKRLLKNVRNKKKDYSESEEEVLDVGAESDPESDLAVSDVEGQEEKDDIPDVKAWGRDKRLFYNADYVDADYGGFEGRDAHLADLEEQEAKNLQLQLAQQLDDDDFSLEVFTNKKSTEENDKTTEEELVQTDISKLSSRQKLQLMQKESPEFFALVEDYEVKMKIAKDFLDPILSKCEGTVPDEYAYKFIQTYQELILNYTTNIYMYLLMKSSGLSLKNHPIIKRLYQYRQLLSQLEEEFEEKLKPQIKLLLLEAEEEKKQKKERKKLKVLLKIKEKTKKSKSEKRAVHFADEEESNKRPKMDENGSSSSDDEGMSDQAGPEMETAENNEQETEGEKRAITYQMKKNKGLTPHRKKEQRNPRVKHKMKYRKAVIRRKGAVREPRTEMTRYGGEMSGIKASVTKSIKIKS